MGLDITYYKHLTPLTEGADPEDGFQPYDNPDFPGRMEGLEDRVYQMPEDRHHFRAGSYSGYNAWREELAELAGYPLTEGDRGLRHDSGAWDATEGPFWELINFADNEGTIGPVVSAKLAKDFAAYQEKADTHPSGHFRDLYAQWRIAFEDAAQDGAVDFH